MSLSFGIPNRIPDIIKKKRLKWFGHVVHNVKYVNHSYKNDFIKEIQITTIKAMEWPNKRRHKITSALTEERLVKDWWQSEGLEFYLQLFISKLHIFFNM